MSLVITQNFVVTQRNLVSGNAGLLGWQNLANTGNTSATSEEALNPISNLFIPATAFYWQATSTATQTITITNPGVIDFIGIARHNLNQAGLTITVKYNGSTVVPATTPDEAQTILFLTNEAEPATVTIEIAGATTVPRVAVLYVGKAIRFERNIYVGHTPITYARDRQAYNGVSESGEYLGEVILNETRSNTVSLKNLTPDWYRQTLDPFLAQQPRKPAFFAWRPEDYPAEIGYVWVTGNPRPVNQRSNGMMSIDMNFRGIS